jgi:hypothetical protein
MTRLRWKDAESIFKYVKEANERLFEIEITPKIRKVFLIIGDIVALAGRFDKLTSKERYRVNHLCWQINAYLNITFRRVWSIALKSDSSEALEAFRKELREALELFKIGTEFFSTLSFVLPGRSEDDIVAYVEKILELCKSKPIRFNLVPLEIAPMISKLKVVRVRPVDLDAFEKSLGALNSCGIPPDLDLLFEKLPLEKPITLLALQYITNLLQSQNVTVIIFYIVSLVKTLETRFQLER